MPRYLVTGPDGKRYNVDAPEGATEDEIKARVQEASIPKDDSIVRGFMGGAIKPIDNLASWAQSLPGAKAVDDFGRRLGLPGVDEAVSRNDAMRRNNSRTGWQTVGNIAGTAPTSYLPGGIFAQGAAAGALLSDGKTTGDVLTDAAISGVTSKGVSSALNTMARAAAPRISRGMRQLADAGVLMTPGQMLSGSKGWIGRNLSRMEEAATSIPFLGDVINMARESGNETLQRAVGNRALGNVGAKIPNRVQAGLPVTDYVSQRLGREYDRLVPNLHATFDQQFGADLANAATQINPLPKAAQNKFQGILRDVFTNRADEGNTSISGANLKAAESRLTEWIKRYEKSASGDDKALGEALRTTRQALRDSVARSNPQFAQQLQALNKGWAQSKVLRSASEATPEGVPSPQQLFQQTRRANVRDPLIRNAAARLRNNTPDSGTARRAMTALGGNAVVGSGLGATFNPAFFLPVAGSMLYTRPGIKALNKAVFTKRGPIAKATGKALRKGARYTAPLLAPFLVNPADD